MTTGTLRVSRIDPLAAFADRSLPIFGDDKPFSIRLACAMDDAHQDQHVEAKDPVT